MYRCYNCGNPVEKISTSCGCVEKLKLTDKTKLTPYSIFKPTSNVLTIEFETPSDAEGFKEWLSYQGEQQFWTEDDVEESGHGYEFFYHIEGGNIIKCFKYKKE